MLRNLLIFLIIINVLKIHFCLGITNIKKINNSYIINIASEHIKAFEQKLENISITLINEFHLIICKVLISTIGPFILFIIYGKITRRFTLRFYLILFFIILICDLAYLIHIYNDYKYAFKSVENALAKFYSSRDEHYNIDPKKSDFKEGKYKINNLGEEMEKYGIHATFCEIPGTLPSNNANPLSYSPYFGGLCYDYKSQRRYLDPETNDYIGDEKSLSYRKIQINKTFDLF